MFPSLRHNNRAVQAVEVVANRGSDAAASKPATSYSASLRSHAFTFCLEKIQAGPYEVRKILRFKVTLHCSGWTG